ncbi:MAG: sulfurtransferase TusA family protein [Candidatus Glassbacteria bacterium]|nr:sulfurtransferase TusA family protein [Candidatus Glassbacteria bacterium]
MAAADDTLNLVGTPCPMNFVQIKTVLDRSEPGRPLAVLVDSGPVGQDLADSLRMGGYDILAIEERGNSLLVTVRKRKIISARPVSRRDDTPCHKSARRRRR